MPCWAVPDLPPTVAPGTAAFVPVPFSTTSVISSRSRTAVAGFIAWRRVRRPAADTVSPSPVVIRSTRCGVRTAPWFATAAATIAICRGVARVLYWPMEDSASCASSTGASKVLGETRNGIPSFRSLNPNASAVVLIASGPTRTPSPAKTVLHDHWKA
jgi:hypothetical protein